MNERTTKGPERMPKFVQPKFEDAKEVERLNLMKVPKRFTFARAKKVIAQDIQILGRSEHPEEAKGLSGVNQTRYFGKDDRLPGETFAEFRKIMLENNPALRHTEQYWDINGIDRANYEKDLSWSFWERIPGMNLSVIQDNSLPDRYWILATWMYQVPLINDINKTRLVYGRNVLAIKGDQIQFKTNPTHYDHIPPQFFAKVPEIIESYDRIKNHFDSNMAWVVEMQLSEKDGKLYFLQRHPTRVFESPDWSFEADSEQGEIVVKSEGANLVRGSTPKEGIEVDMIYDRSADISKLPQQDIYNTVTIRDTITRQRWIAGSKIFLDTEKVTPGESSDPHSSVIPLTKSGLYVSIPDFREKLSQDMFDKFTRVRSEKHKKTTEYMAALRDDLATGKITEEERDKRRSAYPNNPENLLRIKMRVRADGNEARIKILDIH